MMPMRPQVARDEPESYEPEAPAPTTPARPSIRERAHARKIKRVERRNRSGKA